MTLDILILAGMLHVTAPAAPEPVQYHVTAYAIPGASLAWRGFDGWVPADLCYGRCHTVPGQPNRLARGEFSLQDAADLQLTIWRKESGDGDRWVQALHCAQFFTGPVCAHWGTPQ